MDSSSAYSSDFEEEHEEPGELVPLVFMPNLPPMKFHEAPYWFMSEPGITQQEFQKRVLLGPGILYPDADELVTIKCPERANGAGRIFKLNRSVLERSPRLHQFFRSPYHINGCEMQLTFVVDPAICMEWAYAYLLNGPDNFHKDTLKVKVTMKYAGLPNRLEVVIRLYALAQKLLLHDLADMTLDLLSYWTDQVTAEHCITLAGLIYSRGAIFDDILKQWCLRRVTDHAKALSRMDLWNNVLHKADPELKHRWHAITKMPPRRLHIVDEAGEGPAKRTPAKRTYTAPTKGKGIAPPTDEVAQASESEEEEWDLSEALLFSEPMSPVTGNNYKINQLLGPITPTSPSPRGLRFSPSTFFSPGHGKERFVMGFPGSVGSPIKGPYNGHPTPLPTPTKSARKARFFNGH
ncbi:MAG: hypothetical protein LQ346_006439 [Caloplaca aetnensis]|nr:MAG: hypothetical protein LQ346_006439 [Caloplaca aetnensis]